ncbi:MAG TPA: serine/threonine-protein kinase [Acidimicrobiales bacterium]|nr:serine/threonine-protein kinase [Acidimicrobiales bacterium]
MAGRYALLEQLGAGGQGTVFRADDTHTGEAVALKRLDGPSVAPVVPPHPGVVARRGDAVHDGASWAVMDWIDGRSAATDLRANGPLLADEVLRLLAAVADALEHLHAHGVVHGDVKPANIVVRRDGAPVLVDLTAPRPGHGTDGYRAPEVAAGALPGASADTYGLAATAVALLTGDPPAGAGAALNSISPVWRRGLATDPARRPRPTELVAAVAESTPSNLPPPLTDGDRPDELARLLELLAAHRLVSVTGLAGVGKARLVVEAGNHLRHRYPGGVWRVRVDDGLVPASVRALSMPATAALEDIAVRLGALPTLFIVDGAATAAEVDELLAACKGIAMVRAGKEPLGIVNEAVVPLVPRGEVVRFALSKDDRAALVRLSTFRAPFDSALACELACVDGPQLSDFVARGLIEALASDTFSVAFEVGDEDLAVLAALRAWTARRLGHGDIRAFEQARPLVGRAVVTGDDEWLAEVIAGYADEGVCRGFGTEVYAVLDAVRAAPGTFPQAFRPACFAEVSNRHLHLEDITEWAARTGDDGIAAICALRHLARLDDDEYTATELRGLIATFVEVGDEYTEAVAWADLGITLAGRGDTEGGVAALRRSAHLAQAAPNPWTAGMAHNALSTLVGVDLRAPAAAAEHAREALAWFERAGHAMRVSQARANLALYTFDLGAHDEALDIAERALVDAAALGAPRYVVVPLTVIALAHASTDPERTLMLIAAADNLDPGLGTRPPDRERLGAARIAARAALGSAADEVEARGAALDLPAAVEIALAP